MESFFYKHPRLGKICDIFKIRIKKENITFDYKPTASEQIKKYTRYFKYLIRHKYYVFLECRKMDIIWRGIIHDISSFLPPEFIPFSNYLVAHNRGKVCSDEKFQLALLKHYSHTKHHWQHWNIHPDSGKPIPLGMPMKYIKEMVCDWKAIARERGITEKIDFYEWYRHNERKMSIHHLIHTEILILLETELCKTGKYCPDDFDDSLYRGKHYARLLID